MKPLRQRSLSAVDGVPQEILLLKGESPSIDDWLYDERVDPRLHPVNVREAAIRLLARQKYWALWREIQ